MPPPADADWAVFQSTFPVVLLPLADPPPLELEQAAKASASAPVPMAIPIGRTPLSST
jgi:hypothetical protein